MTIRTEQLRYQADGLQMHGDIYWNDAEATPRPGILVFPEAFGLGAHARSKAERLAGHGYIALACDLHGEAAQIGMDELKTKFGPLASDPLRIRARAQAGLKTLLARPEVAKDRIAAIGFCFGGTMAFELARSGASIRAAVGFHSGLGTSRPEDAKAITGKILACIGADDPGIPPEQRAAFEAEMRAAGVDWRLHLYGGVVHSFTNPDADARGMPDFARYDAGAEERSWSEMLALFDEAFG
jgi:dienelactone hydrolase